MTSVSGTPPTCRPAATRAARILAPFFFALLGTIGGVAVANLVGRARGHETHVRHALDLAPGVGSLEFDKGGVRVRAEPGHEEPPYSFEPEEIMTLPEALRPAAGIRPTFDVEAELARALDAAPEPALTR